MAQSQSMVDRMIKVSFLDIPTIEQIEHDQDATGQAAGVVALVAVCSAIGAWNLGPIAMAGNAIGALVGWVVWAGIAFVIGKNIFGGDVTWGEMLRTLGFAQAPGVLLVTGLVPILSWPILAAASLWMLVTAFVATRQALDLGNGKTFLTIVIGWFALAVLRSIFL